MSSFCRFKGDRKLEPSEDITLTREGNTYSIILRGVKMSEAGTYTVKVVADLGTLSADASLTVLTGKTLKSTHIYAYKLNINTFCINL